MNRIGVLQITDSLMLGGMERMAVNVANHLPRHRFTSHFCTTRTEGPLAWELASDVRRVQMARRHRYDLRPVRRLAAYLRDHRIRILHAHGSSLFVAAVASLVDPRLTVIWHDNFGRGALEERSVWRYRLAARRASAVVAANESLAEWSRRRLGVPAGRVWYVPNFVAAPRSEEADLVLPGTPGSRLVCVANLRREKDHPTLLRAMELVLREAPAAHLLLLGGATDRAWVRALQQEMARRGLSRHVSWLGCRTDVGAILKQCDVGVLSSASEGLPLALIEYGFARLAVVATRVGQCAEVLADGRAGMLVPPAAPAELAQAILGLLASPAKRAELGQAFFERVRQAYSAEAVMHRLCAIYEAALAIRHRGEGAPGGVPRAPWRSMLALCLGGKAK